MIPADSQLVSFDHE